MVAPQRRKALVCHYIEDRSISIRRACRIFNISVTCYYHKSVVTDENQQIADLLIKLTDENKNWGFGLCFLTLRNVLGLPYNHKRVYRIYCELELNLRIKPKRRIKRAKPIPLAVPDRINQSWSMDFMHDSLTDGRGFRLFNPQQNAYVERFNRTMRYDWLNQELFDNLEQVRAQAENWLYHYNHKRPNMGNGGFTPIQKLNQAA